MTPMAASPLIDVDDSVLVLIDMQPALVPLVLAHERLVEVQCKIIAAARELAVPIVVTEHYSKGLGATIPEIVAALGGTAADSAYRPLEKIIFSAWGDEGFRNALEATGRHTPVMIGIETHICVCQTALEAAAAGFDVHVVPDAVSCRNEEGQTFGLARMRDYGVALDTWEMLVYQWMRRAGTPEFKRILPLLKAGPREP